MRPLRSIEVDHMGRRSQPFIGDRRVERREIDRPHRLGAEHERIIPHAFMIDLRFQCELAQTIEARFRLVLDAALEQMRGGEIARILQRPAQGQRAATAAVVILRRPVILPERAASLDRRQGDRAVADQRVGLQALAQRRQIAQRLDGGTGLAHGLRRAVELAERIGESARHRQDAAGLVFQDDHRSLGHGTHPQFRAERPCLFPRRG